MMFDDDGMSDDEWAAENKRQEALLRRLTREDGEEWEDYADRIGAMKFMVRHDMRHLVRRKMAKAGTLQAATTLRNGVPFVPIEARWEHEARMQHDDVRAEIRQRVVAILTAAGAVKHKCECHRRRPEWRRILWALVDVEAGERRLYDSEGVPHTCFPSEPAG